MQVDGIISKRFTAAIRARLLVVLAVAFSGLAQVAGGGEPLPPFEQVQQLVHTQLATKTGYQPGDLITASDVRPILVVLHEHGLQLSGPQYRFEVFLKDNDVLAELIRSQNGQKLMRELKAIPNFYDRMQRLCSFDDGKRMVQELFARGDKHALEYLCSTEGAQRIIKEYGHLSEVKNFETVSGRVYTEADLLSFLQTAYILSANNLGMPSR